MYKIFQTHLIIAPADNTSDQFWTFKPYQTGSQGTGPQWTTGACKTRVKLQPGVCFRGQEGMIGGGRRWVLGGIKGLRLIVPIWKGANGRPSQLGIWNPRGAPGPDRTMAPPLPSRSVSSCRNLRPTTRAGGAHLYSARAIQAFEWPLIKGEWEKFTWMLLAHFMI